MDKETISTFGDVGAVLDVDYLTFSSAMNKRYLECCRLNEQVEEKKRTITELLEKVQELENHRRFDPGLQVSMKMGVFTSYSLPTCALEVYQVGPCI